MVVAGGVKVVAAHISASVGHLTWSSSSCGRWASALMASYMAAMPSRVDGLGFMTSSSILRERSASCSWCSCFWRCRYSFRRSASSLLLSLLLALLMALLVMPPVLKPQSSRMVAVGSVGGGRERVWVSWW